MALKGRIDATYDEELDPLVLDDLEVDGGAEVTDVDPAGAPLDGILRPGGIVVELIAMMATLMMMIIVTVIM